MEDKGNHHPVEQSIQTDRIIKKYKRHINGNQELLEDLPQTETTASQNCGQPSGTRYSIPTSPLTVHGTTSPQGGYPSKTASSIPANPWIGHGTKAPQGGCSSKTGGRVPASASSSKFYVDVEWDDPNSPPIYVGYDDEVEDYDDDVFDKMPDLDRLQLDESRVDDGLVIPIEECRILWKPWRRALIIRLLGKSVSLKTLQYELKDIWGLQVGCDLVSLNKGFYVVRFYSEGDYHHVLGKGPWMVFGRYLTVVKWRPYFIPMDEFIGYTLVWIKFPELPIEFCNHDFLLGLGNRIGKAVKVDPRSISAIRGKYARMLVEIDLKKPLVQHIGLLGKSQDVVYEGLGRICFNCGMYGHELEQCYRRRF